MALLSTYKCHVWLQPPVHYLDFSVLRRLLKRQFYRTLLTYDAQLFLCIHLVACFGSITIFSVRDAGHNLADSSYGWSRGLFIEPMGYSSKETSFCANPRRRPEQVYFLNLSLQLTTTDLSVSRVYKTKRNFLDCTDNPSLIASDNLEYHSATLKVHVGGRLHPVLVVDVAAAVIAAIRDEGFSMSKTFELGGPDVFTVNELISIPPGQRTGHYVRFVVIHVSGAWRIAFVNSCVPLRIFLRSNCCEPNMLLSGTRAY